MKKQTSSPILFFLWRSDDISAALVDVASQTSTAAIFDISASAAKITAQVLRDAGATDVKIPLEFFMDPALDEFLQASQVGTVWVEYHPALASCPPDAFIERLSDVSALSSCIPVSGDLNFLTRALRAEKPPPTIAIKGAEASGFVSRETTGILYAILKEMASPREPAPGLIIWGGIAAPEAAAAFLCTGAKGIVFESLHWQTDRVAANHSLKQRLAKLRPEHTTLVGQSLDVPCRFFDKGNSVAVKELRQYADSQFGCEVSENDRSAFAQHVRQTAVSALDSDLGRRDLVFIGPESTFAEAFAERFGRSTREALAAFSQEVDRICREAPHQQKAFVKSAAARELGIEFPFLQGAMTWISDRPDFARAVADAGGLPAIALGLKSRSELERSLGGLEEVMRHRPYAVNFIALQENPHLDQQLEWIEQSRPPFAVIAAGEPSYAVRLHEKGIHTLYIATSEGLVRLALKAGVRFVILEGNEAGGHVGEHSTLTLAQIALALKQKEPQLFKDRYLVLAGGIFSRETAFRASVMGADAVQMGTAYLATREIVSSGALSPLYQRLILESQPGMTEVTGESVGLRVRSLRTPTMDAICTLEREYTAGQHDETSFRHHLEALSANSLLIAARGMEQPDGHAMDEETCMRKGQFMSGAVSATVNTVRTLSDFHRDLAEGPLNLTVPEIISQPAPQEATPRVGSRQEGERVAITAMSVANSLGIGPEEIWEACLSGKSGISEVPLSRWDHTLFYDPDPRTRGKTYCNVGAFMNIDISRKELGIAPQDFRSMADSTRLTLWLAEQAIRQSGLLETDIPRERIGVLVSQNSGESAATINDLVIDVNCNEIIDALRDFIPMTPELEQAITAKIKSGRLRVDDTTLLGRLNCAAGGFVCNKYGLRGPSHSVSAACASSLVALYNAIQMIKNGILDAAVVGGGEEYVHPSHYLEFSALKALAKLSGRERPPHECSRPFDASRDGMVLGEGGGMIIVERESVAKKRGAAIHAYITGIGASNNDRGMVESLAEPQLIAIRASYRDAGYSPGQVDLVECHATSTVQGDIEEVKALKAIKSPGARTMLTSFKSQIGHTLGASGINSLIRGVTAMQAGVFPPTINYQAPDPEIGLEAAGFYVPVQPEEWPEAADRPRRLQVNAFGFGGANYVVQLEACRQSAGRVMIPPPRLEGTGVSTPPGRENPTTIQGASFFTAHLAGRSHRVGVVAPTESDARAKVEGLALAEEAGPLSKKALRVMGRQGVFASPADQPNTALAYVFAGQGTQYVGMGQELYEAFPEVRKWMDKIADRADFDLLDLLFNSTEEDLQKTRWQQPALYTMEFAMVQQLIAMGAVPAAMAGHSLGELVALAVAGVFSYEDGFGIVNTRARCMDKASELRGDPGTMVAVDAPLDYLEEKVAASENVYYTNFNSPHQMVIGGDTAPVLALMQTIKNDGHRATQLNVSMAFHSPIMKVIHDEMAAYVADIAFHPPKIPVISNTTMAPYPEDPDQIRRILMQHLETPVHWMQNVKTLWDDFDIRTFVEIGPKDTLCNLVSEILEPVLCFPACMPEAEAQTYRRAVAHLYALGHLTQSGVPLSAPTARQSAPTPLPAAAALTPSVPGDRVGAIVQREINAFILESFGKIIKPQIVETVRREVDPGFTQNHLERILGHPGLPQTVAPAAPLKIEQAAPAVPEASPAAPSAAPGTQQASVADKIDYVEQTIRIIMEATGYERDEIEPEMDIRQDLAIRSSRLPVIMDDIERQFKLTVNVEDFIDKRTVQEIADCIEMLANKTNGSGLSEPSQGQPPTATVTDTQEAPAGDPPVPDDLINRLVLEEVAAPATVPVPLALETGQEVALLATGPDSRLAADVSRRLEEKFGARILYIDCLGQGEESQFDLRTAEGARSAGHRLMESPSLAGVVLVMDSEAESPFSGPEEAAAFLGGFFACLKSLTRSKNKAFCLSLLREVAPDSPTALAGEGVLGMFLAATQEYPSLLFRSVALDSGTTVDTALDFSLDTANPVIQLFYRGQEAFTFAAANEPLHLTKTPTLELGAGDVVVITGGAKGVTYRIARALAPFRARVILLGRTDIDLESAYETLQGLDGPVDDALCRMKEKKKSGDSDPANETDKNLAALEIARNVSRLSTLGLKVSYHCCDVADSRKVAQTLEGVVKQFGRIDGIIHGAGLTRDNFMEYMTPEDFERVMAVKLLGAWNLYRAASDCGLRFFAGLSSIVAIQGNVGQVNYCAANRSMAALLRSLPSSNPGLVSKALMLPPIEGTGMADNADVKELMERKGLASAFVHADEFAQMFCRELFTGPPHPAWVILARTFPAVKGTRVDADVSPGGGAGLSVGGIWFRKPDLPMIDTVENLDLNAGELYAKRTFSHAVDLWIDDHKPFKHLKHPLVSAIMAVETFLEAAHLLYPHLAVQGVRRLTFEDILECPPEMDRIARIACRKEETVGQEVCCSVTLTSADISPSGRPLDRWSTNYQGQVILAPKPTPLPATPEMDIGADELDTPPLTPKEVQESYEAVTGLTGRYRVLDNIHGTGPGVIMGEMVYREETDMAGLDEVRYQYSPYLLESLMHLLAFYAALRQEDQTADLIPAGMEQMRFTRRADDGERFTLAARLRVTDDRGVTWDAQALDISGTPVMQVVSMRMNRFKQ